MPELTNGLKNWYCRRSLQHPWTLHTSNNPKVTVEFVASHYLSWNKTLPEGEHTVYVKDPATQEVFKVVLRQHYEVIDGEKRGWRDLVSLEEIVE